jgi:hypothetical protein
MKILEIFSGRFLLNILGASIRWSYGSIWRNIFRKKRFTFVEYLYGPKNSEDWFDQTGHTFVNRVIGLIFLAILAIIILKLN